MSLDDTLRRLPPGAVDYARSLFDHHWAEASWLYERRKTLRSQGALVSPDQWMGIEQRAEAHVAALRRGDRLVFDDCEARALEGDIGELHTAVRLLARADRSEDFASLVDALDWYEPARAWAVTDALTWEAPDGWQDVVGTMLADDELPEDAAGPLARAAAMRGWPLREPIVGILERRSGELQDTAWAAGWLRVAEAQPLLYALVEESGEPEVRQAAALAALRFAPGEVLAFLEHVVAAEDWAAIPLAVGGGRRAWDALSSATRGSPSPQRALAVGLLGHAGGIDVLLPLLDDPRCGDAAAEALHLLTGAPLHEETHLESPNGDSSSDDDEAEDRPGLLVSRVSRSVAAWTAWLRDNGPGLPRSETRMRGGVPFEPHVSLDGLAATRTDAQLREWMVEELAVRYRVDVGAWPRLRQTTLQAAVERGRQDTDETQKLVTGVWYQAGLPLRS